MWDLSLVDPDNRRPVDYQLRQHCLATLPQRVTSEQARELVENKADGRIKLFVTSRALHFRKQHQDLFKHGKYLPLVVQGKQSEHICAFERVATTSTDTLTNTIIVVPRLLARLTKNTLTLPLGEEVWKNASLVLPDIEAKTEISKEEAVLERYRNIFTGEILETVIQAGQIILPLEKVLANFPVALLEKLETE
jgi:(1->4)-alpha-D-glucan 1-alpha-D-glucosylmutase